MINTIKTQIEYCNTPVRESLEKFRNEKNLIFIDSCIKQWEDGKQFPKAWSDSINESPALNVLKKVIKKFCNPLETHLVQPI